MTALLLKVIKPVSGASGSRNTPRPFPPPEAWIVWDFSQPQPRSCCRWQKTQPVLPVSCIPKEAATFPEPFGNAFESLRKVLIHPAQSPGSNLSSCGGATNKASKGASSPRLHLAEPAFPRISDVGRLFLKPSSCLFCHSDQTQWVGMLKLYQKRV